MEDKLFSFQKKKKKGIELDLRLFLMIGSRTVKALLITAPPLRRFSR